MREKVKVVPPSPPLPFGIGGGDGAGLGVVDVVVGGGGAAAVGHVLQAAHIVRFISGQFQLRNIYRLNVIHVKLTQK